MAKKQSPPTKTETPRNLADDLREMRTKGFEQILPETYRKIRLRHVDASTLLRDNKLPDELTPLVVRSVYEEVRDEQVVEFLGKKRDKREDALAHLDTLDYIASKAIADNTKVEDLTLEEKRWIFRLVMGPADVLVKFRLLEDDDVGDMDAGEDVSPTAA